MTQTASPDVSAVQARRQVEAIVRALYDAWQIRDEGKIRQFFANTDDLVLWGTDAFERIVGRPEADRDFASWIATCPPWTAINLTFRIMDVTENLAWVADEVTGKWQNGTQAGSDTYRITTIWRNGPHGWKLIHGNFAHPQ